MPLMSLAAMAIDQPKPRGKVVDHTLRYLHADGACVRYEPGPLALRQAQARRVAPRSSRRVAHRAAVLTPLLRRLRVRLSPRAGCSRHSPSPPLTPHSHPVRSPTHARPELADL
jgi:hypothetical protein